MTPPPFQQTVVKMAKSLPMIRTEEAVVRLLIVLVKVSFQTTMDERILLRSKTVGGRKAIPRNATIGATAKDISLGK